MIKLTFELYPEDGRIKPYEHPYGYIFRGIIMNWLKEIKPALVHELHEFEEVRPYSINCIIQNKVPKIDFVLVSYDDALSDALLKDLLSSEKAKLKIGQKDYFISKISFERFSPNSFIEPSKPVNNFNVNFVKPTYFSSKIGNFPVRFPIPAVLFNNLANIWNSIFINQAEVDQDHLVDWINAHVYVSGYNMRSVKANIGKPSPVAGGLGNASYKVKKINEKYYEFFVKEMHQERNLDFVNENYLNNCRWLEILCRMGELTNVGGNRTAGLGVMRYYPKTYVLNEDLLQNK